jgi:hypothetical protein
MAALQSILALLCVAAGAFATLMMVGLCIAGTPNSKPEQLRMILAIGAAIGAGGVISLIAAVVLLVRHSPGWAALAGGLPMIVCFAGLVWLSWSA